MCMLGLSVEDKSGEAKARERGVGDKNIGYVP